MSSNTMKYLGYTAAIQFDDDDGLFYGDVVDLRDTITFSGSSVEELENAFHIAVDDYIEFCESRGEEPEKPFSGRFVLRIDPALHRSASIAALAQQVSLNTFITRAIERDIPVSRARREAARGSLPSRRSSTRQP